MIRITLPEAVKRSAIFRSAQVVPGSFPIEVWVETDSVFLVIQDGNKVDYLAQLDGTAYQITAGVCRVWLAQVGEALYGQRWQSELARELNVSDRTMRRWLQLDMAHPAPQEIRPKIVKLLEDRIALIRGLVLQADECSSTD